MQLKVFHIKEIKKQNKRETLRIKQEYMLRIKGGKQEKWKTAHCIKREDKNSLKRKHS